MATRPTTRVPGYEQNPLNWMGGTSAGYQQLMSGGQPIYRPIPGINGVPVPIGHSAPFLPGTAPTTPPNGSASPTSPTQPPTTTTPGATPKPTTPRPTTPGTPPPSGLQIPSWMTNGFTPDWAGMVNGQGQLDRNAFQQWYAQRFGNTTGASPGPATGGQQVAMTVQPRPF